MKEDRYQYIRDNINYILAPYYIINQKSTVTTINYQKIKKMPDKLLKIVADYLVHDSDELYTYINELKEDKNYIKNNLNNVYLGTHRIEIVYDYHDRCNRLLLNAVKKYLNKINDQDGIKKLLEYYKRKDSYLYYKE